MVKEKKSGKWSVWKELDFQNVYRMNGGADVDSIMDRDNIVPAFNGDGYTTYKLGNVNRLIVGAQSPEFAASLSLPLPVEVPSPTDSQNAINTKAQAWYTRNQTHIDAELRRFIALIGAPRFSVIGARYYHPKYDSNPSTASSGAANDRYPPGTQITTNSGAVIDPDDEWSPGVQGAEIDEVAFIFRNIANADRATIVGRHEVGHASEHIQFGLGDGNNQDHASSGLMHPTADIPGMPPNGNPNFSPISIRRLRGVRP